MRNRVSVKTDRNCNKTEYSYGTLSYTYNNSDEISGIQTSVNGVTTGNTSYEYDLMDRITRVVGHDGSATLYEYDAIGNRTKVRHEGGLTVDYQYDTCSRLVNETINAADDVAFTSLDFEELISSDELLRILDTNNITWSGNITYQYSYDKVSNRTSKVAGVTGNVSGLDEDIQAGTTEYTYNAKNQLITATVSSGNAVTIESYSYDYEGNRITATGGIRIYIIVPVFYRKYPCKHGRGR